MEVPCSLVCTVCSTQLQSGKRPTMPNVQTNSQKTVLAARETPPDRTARQPAQAQSSLTQRKRTARQLCLSTVTPVDECSPLLAVAAMHPCGGGSVLREVPAPLAASCRPRRPRRGSLFSLAERRVFPRLGRRRACAGHLPRRPWRGAQTPAPLRSAVEAASCRKSSAASCRRAEGDAAPPPLHSPYPLPCSPARASVKNPLFYLQLSCRYALI